MKIEYSKKAAKYIEALDRPTKQRIKSAIEGLTEQPPAMVVLHTWLKL